MNLQKNITLCDIYVTLWNKVTLWLYGIVCLYLLDKQLLLTVLRDNESPIYLLRQPFIDNKTNY